MYGKSDKTNPAQVFNPSRRFKKREMAVMVDRWSNRKDKTVKNDCTELELT